MELKKHGTLSPALFCFLITPQSDITHTGSEPHQPTSRTAFGVVRLAKFVPRYLIYPIQDFCITYECVHVETSTPHIQMRQRNERY